MPCTQFRVLLLRRLRLPPLACACHGRLDQLGVRSSGRWRESARRLAHAWFAICALLT